MINSTVKQYKRLKVDTEGELQPGASSEYQGIKKQLNIIQSTINQQTINIQCNSATFTTDVAILNTIKILFPVPNDVFTGRDVIFDELTDYLTKQQIVVICGMAGIGKTECSKKFAWKNSAKYGMKLWINTDSQENIQKSVQEIGRKLSISVDDRDVANIINDIYDYFENRNILSLFIFDNANDRRSINHLLPAKEFHDNTFIHIIVTSQNNKWGKRNRKPIPTIELDPLETNDAVDVFHEIIDENFDDYEIALWENLSKFLNGIPLALQITAAYIKSEIESIAEFGSQSDEFSLRGYIKKLKEGLHLIIDESFPDDSENAYPRTIYIAVKMALDKIKLQSAFDLLYAISYVGPDYIYSTLLETLMPEEEIRKSLEILSKYSLINTINYRYSREVGIHRLIQWIIRYHQEKCGREVQTFHYKKIFTILVDKDPYFQENYPWLLKHELTFKNVIRDYYILNFNKIHVIIDNNSINSLLLLCESLERTNTKDPIKWMTIALDLGSKKSFQTLYEYLQKIYFNTMNDGIVLLFVMHIKEFLTENFSDIFHQLLEKCTDVNVSDSKGFGFTPIMIAAHRGQNKLMQLLLETNKVDVNRTDKMGWTVYHFLIRGFFLYNNNALSPENIGSLLIKLGFNINVIDQSGRSLLHQACKFTSAPYVKFLIDHNLDVNLKDKNGIPPLFTCFEYTPTRVNKNIKIMHLTKNEVQLIACIDLLTKNGANVNARNKDGKTILHFAAKFYPLVVDYLVKTHKMDLELLDKLGVTPSHEIRNRNPYFNDVEKMKITSGIVFYTEAETQKLLETSYLTWILNCDKSNFEDFSCIYHSN